MFVTLCGRGLGQGLGVLAALLECLFAGLFLCEAFFDCVFVRWLVISSLLVC